MDIYGYSYEDNAVINGAGMSPVTVERLLEPNSEMTDGHRRLTESEKEQLIFRYRDARDDDERKAIINELLPDEEAVRAVSHDGGNDNMHTAEKTHAGDIDNISGEYGDIHRDKDSDIYRDKDNSVTIS